MPLTELSFGLPGRIFRSPMPFGLYDLHGEVYDRFREEQITVVVLLAAEDECLHKTGHNLRVLYLQEGLQVLYLPIPDFGVPTKDDLAQAVIRTIVYAQAGHNIVVHCSAGIGRTGLFLASLAKRALGLSGEEALTWIRRSIPRASVSVCHAGFVEAVFQKADVFDRRIGFYRQTLAGHHTAPFCLSRSQILGHDTLDARQEPTDIRHTQKRAQETLPCQDESKALPVSIHSMKRN